MPKRRENLDTLRLSLELLNRIPRGRYVSASDLHNQLKDAGFDRDLRTIQRLLNTLSSEDFGIQCDNSTKPYGYRWMDSAKGLAVPTLTAQQSLLLILAKRQLENLLPSKLMKSMAGFFEQAKLNLGPDRPARLEREWSEKIRVVADRQPLLPAKIATGVFEAVSEALYNNLWLNIDYRNAEEKLLHKRVMPLGLVQQGSSLYLVCQFEGYDNFRHLALHRLRKAEASTLSFERPSFNLKKYDEDGRFGFGYGERIQLTFIIQRDAGFHLTETPLSTDQQVTENANGWLEISATVVDSTMLDWWLNGFGKNVKDVVKVPIKA